MNHLREAVASISGVQLGDEAIDRLQRFTEWLGGEAIEAGGLGPNEAGKLLSRHVLDSLAFSAGWAEPPDECWDLGSGVGLPGIPLAVIWPETRVRLIDRSGRRCDLARRAARVAGIDVEVRQEEIRLLDGPVEAIVSRAAIPAQRFAPLLQRILAPGGRAVISGGRGAPDGFQTLDLGFTSEILDPPPRLLMMAAT